MRVTIQQIRSTPVRMRSTAWALLSWSIQLVLVAAALFPSVVWSVEPEIVGRVNGEPVTRAELQRMLADPRAQHQIQQEIDGNAPDSKELDRLGLQKLIQQRLLLRS